MSSLPAIGDNSLIGGRPKTESTSVVGNMIGDDAGVLAVVRISASLLTVPSRIIDISDDDQLTTVANQLLVPMLLEPRR